jgi:hypothetical protein
MQSTSRENKDSSGEVARSAADFVRRRFGAAPRDLFVLIWTKQGEVKQSHWLPVSRLSEALPFLAPFCAPDAGDAYLGVGLSPQDFGPHNRCSADAIAGVSGLWIDLDVRGETHKKSNMPPTLDAARELARAVGLLPTEEIHSGHGLQAWWLFDRPWIFRDGADRQRAADLVRRFQDLLRAQAKSKGWEVDSTHDLARILRLAGTFNCKIAPPVPVRQLTMGGPRYEMGDLLALVPPDDPSGDQAEGAQGSPFAGRASGNGASVLERARRYVGHMPPALSGQHGHQATWAVAQVLLRGFDLPVAQAQPLLEEYNLRCKPPWTAKELQHKLEQAEQKSRLPRGYLLDGAPGRHAPHGSRRKTSSESESSTPPGSGSAPAGGAKTSKKPARLPEPFRSFPTQLLPEPLRSFVEQGATALGCDASYLALPALSVAAALIGNARSIRLKRDWHEPAIVWTGVIGDSGTLKSPALATILSPVYRLQKGLLKKHKADLAEYRRQKAAFAARKKKGKLQVFSPGKNDKPCAEEEPERPLLAQLVTSDVTVEKLAVLLQDNPKGILVSRDELGGWLNSFVKYKSKGGASDLPNWLELHRAGTLIVDRKTGDRPSLFIPHAAVSVAGGVQFGSLARALTPEYFEAGLTARLLWAMPPKRRKRWTEVEIAPEAHAAYDKLLSQLRDLQLDEGAGGDREPFAVRLTPLAKEAWVKFYEEWAREQAAVEGDLAAAFSKLEGYAARFALIHHVVSRVGDLEDGQPIEPVSIEAGIALAQWFADEARRIYATLRESAAERQFRRLIEFIRQHDGRMTPRMLHQSNRSRYPNVETAEAALQQLVDADLADWIWTTPSPQGGRPSQVFVLRAVDTLTPKPPKTSDPDEDGCADEEEGDTPKPTPKPQATSENLDETEGFGGFGVWGTKTDCPREQVEQPGEGSPGETSAEEVSGYGGEEGEWSA